MNDATSRKWSRPAERLAGAASPIIAKPLAGLVDELPDRLVEQALLPLGVVADDVEDPDVADQVGDLAEVRREAADLGDRLARARSPGVGSRVIQIGCSVRAGVAEVGLDPAMGVLLRTFMTWARSFQSPPLKPLTIRAGMSTERSSSVRALAKYSQWPSLRLTRKSSTGSSVGVDRRPSGACS